MLFVLLFLFSQSIVLTDNEIHDRRKLHPPSLNRVVVVVVTRGAAAAVMQSAAACVSVLQADPCIP